MNLIRFAKRILIYNLHNLTLLMFTIRHPFFKAFYLNLLILTNLIHSLFILTAKFDSKIDQQLIRSHK